MMNAFLTILPLITTSGGYQLRPARECIPLDFHDSYYTVAVNLGNPCDTGDCQKRVNAVVDTGSDDLVIDGSFETPSTKHSGETELLGYGSGDVTAELVTDTVQVGATVVSDQRIKLMEYNDFDFNIDGIMPLGPESESPAWKTSVFSLCVNAQNNQGILQMGKGGEAKVETTGQWKASLTGISVDGKSSGIDGSAIPDSGTTLLVAPSYDVLTNLFLKICSEWENCKCPDGKTCSNTDAFFMSVESDCGRTLPPITLEFGHVSAVIPGASYVVRGEMSGRCVPAFDVDESFEFWILGLPLFRSNQVHFSSSGKFGFSDGCDTCGGRLEQEPAESIMDDVWKLAGPPRRPTRSAGRALKHELNVGTNDESVDPNVAALVIRLNENWADAH